MRRVITGVDADGRSRIESVDAPTPTVEFGPGFAVTDLWRVDAPPAAVGDGDAPEAYAFEPTEGAIFRTVVIPPDEVVRASIAAGERWGRNSPYRRTGEDYGLHATRTQDWVVVLSGQVGLRMPDGEEVPLAPGDVVIQRGAEHAWRNHGTEPVVLAVAMLGVERDGVEQDGVEQDGTAGSDR